MLRAVITGIASALFAGMLLALLWKPAAPVAPPNSVIVNFQPPEPVRKPAPRPKAKVPAPSILKPKPAVPAAPAAPKPAVSKGTWKRVVIIDGRKCYEPRGGGPITTRYCE